MKHFNSQKDTLYLPLLGKIYVSKNFPNILYDEEALKVEGKLPDDIRCISRLVQYTYLSGSIRSKKIDEKIDDFLYLNPDGVVVELNCRLSTACYRNKTSNRWYGVDVEENISTRENLFTPQYNIRYIKGDIFNSNWLEIVLKENPDVPILIFAAGVFNYYEKSKVESLLKYLYGFENLEIIFDAVNSKGMRRMKKFYQHLGIKNYKSLFYLDKVEDLHIDNTNAVVLDDTPFFERIDKKGLNFITKLYMKIADLLNMIKIYHISN